MGNLPAKGSEGDGTKRATNDHGDLKNLLECHGGGGGVIGWAMIGVGNDCTFAVVFIF